VVNAACLPAVMKCVQNPVEHLAGLASGKEDDDAGKVNNGNMRML
jgi:hypothetical protein